MEKRVGEMRFPSRIARNWGALPITAKFTLAFGLLLLIILLEMVIGYAAMTVVWRSNNAILEGAEIHRLVMGMQGKWEAARRLQKDFSLHASPEGVDQAYELYALPAGGVIAEVIRDGATLRRMIWNQETIPNFEERKTDLNVILLTVSQYATTFEELIALEQTLDGGDGGLAYQLAQNAEELHDILDQDGQPEELLAGYYELRFYHAEFINTHTATSSEEVVESAMELRLAIVNSEMPAMQRETALAALDEFERVAREIFQTVSQIEEKIDTLDVLGESIDPILVSLMASIETDVATAHEQIDRTRQTATVMFLAAMLIGLLFAGSIAYILHNSLTARIVRLTQVAGKFHDGDLQARAPVGSTDELGQLASRYNQMAKKIQKTIYQLRDTAQALQLLSVAVNAAGSGVVVTDKTGKMIMVNAAICQLTGYKADELVGENIRILKSGYHDEAFYQNLWRTISQGKVWEGEIVNQRKDGAIYTEYQTISPVSQVDGEITHYIAIKQDMTERIRAERMLRETRDELARRVVEVESLHEQLREQAIRDSLTGLFNRRYLDETMPRELSRAQRDRISVTLVMIDIDRFKNVNDTYGHATGDRMLVKLGNILSLGARREDVVCRYGGEEFIVLLLGASLEEAAQRAEEWREQFGEVSVMARGAAVSSTISAGVVEWMPGESPASLIARADVALYSAKNAGRNCVSAPGLLDPSVS